MKIETKPVAGALLAVLVYILLWTLIFTQASCCSVGGARTANVYRAYERTVLIQITCLAPDMNGVAVGFGSGVIVAPNRILTAAHVAQAGAICSFDVTGQDNKTRHMQPRTVLPDVDLASMLVTEGPPFDVSPVLYGPKPLIGSTVCSASAFPNITRKCGDVLPYTRTPGDMRVLIVVEPGNSGSGLYDEDGRLVAIVVMRVTGVSNQTFEGKAATLQNHLAELLK